MARKVNSSEGSIQRFHPIERFLAFRSASTAKKNGAVGFFSVSKDDCEYTDQIVVANTDCFSRWISRHPYLMLMLSVLPCLACVVLFGLQILTLGMPEINLEYDQFKLTGDLITNQADMLEVLKAGFSYKNAAPSGVGVNAVSYGRSLLGATSAWQSNTNFMLIYRTSSASNMLDPLYLKQCAALEKYTLGKLEWTSYCVKDGNSCSFSESTRSVFTYLYPEGAAEQTVSADAMRNEPYLAATLRGLSSAFQVCVCVCVWSMGLCLSVSVYVVCVCWVSCDTHGITKPRSSPTT
jgi:hypothetical protein